MPINTDYLIELADAQPKTEAGYTTKNLIYFLYLTGARVSEAQEVTVADFANQNEAGVNQVVVKVHTRKKRSGLPYRLIPIKSNQPNDKLMLSEVLRYHASIKKRDGATGVLFPKSRQHLWRKLHAIKFNTQVVIRTKDVKEVISNYSMRLHPHFLRHCRATDLVNVYGYNPFQLQAVMGWSSVEPASVYVSLDWRSASRLLLGLNSIETSNLAQDNTLETQQNP